MDFHGPDDWHPRTVVRWIFTGLTALLVGIIVEENIRYVAQERHWNEFLSHGLEAMPDLAPLLETRWFWWLFGASLGASAYAWIIRFLPSAVTVSGQLEPLKDWDPRIFHFDTHVNFDRLDEFLIVFDFRFFNGTEHTIVRGDTVIGWIYLYDPSEWIIIRDPRFQNSQSKVHNKPFQPFTITLEQRVTPDQQDAIRRGLDSGQSIRFIFSNLNVQLGSADAKREWHRPRVWDGVTCAEMMDRAICERICDVSALGQGAPHQ